MHFLFQLINCFLFRSVFNLKIKLLIVSHLFCSSLIHIYRSCVIKTEKFQYKFSEPGRIQVWYQIFNSSISPTTVLYKLMFQFQVLPR
jgi:hypothetical protein